MFTLAVPGSFVASLVAAAVVVGLHLLARHERRAEPLPTARFVPNDLASSVVRFDRLRDRALLALRVAALLLIGLAAARPTWTRQSAGTMRVIMVDRSGSAVSLKATLDSVRSLALGGRAQAQIVAFDSVPRVVTLDALGLVLLDTTARRAQRGSISTALVAGVREALTLGTRYERVELHLVSPVTTGEVDAATRGVRALWPDSLLVHRIAAPEETAPLPPVDVELNEDDPVSAAAHLVLRRGDLGGSALVRMLRGAPTRSDSVWGGGGGKGHVLVIWPAQDTTARPDTLVAVATGEGAVVAYFTRSAIPSSGTPIAWWSDGAVAAREVPNGEGCSRVIGFSPPVTGDGALSFGMQRLMRRLAAPCGPIIDASPLAASHYAELVAPPQPVARKDAALPAVERSWIAVWLLVGALLMLLAEWYLRERPERMAERQVSVTR